MTKAAWSAWNAVGTPPGSAQPISVTYWMNRLQNLDPKHDVFITLKSNGNRKKAQFMGKICCPINWINIPSIIR